jgi:hypothetical protein
MPNPPRSQSLDLSISHLTATLRAGFNSQFPSRIPTTTIPASPRMSGRGRSIPSSEPVLHAATTSPEPALFTHHRKEVTKPSALLTHSSTTGKYPLFVSTVVALAQVYHFLCDAICTLIRCLSCRWRFTIDDLFRAGLETFFIPLRASTGLPIRSAKVAELMTAGASVSG